MEPIVFKIDWTRVAMVIGLFASIGGVIFYGRRERN
jgi:hypothetical protein